jgi:hypothetical protein
LTCENVYFLPAPNEVSWQYFVDRLQPEDAKHVEIFCQRVTKFATRNNMPMAVLGVGSVVNNEQPNSYHDVDIALMPIDCADEKIERLLASFVISQRETICDQFDKPVENEWWNTHYYDHCRHWHLDFDIGRTINVFVYTNYRRITLLEKRIMEATDCGSMNHKFAYKIIT